MTTYTNQQWLLDKRPKGMPENEPNLCVFVGER